MKLLSQTLPHVRQFLRRPRVFSAMVLACLVGLELVGRTLSSDVYDTLNSSALLILGSMVVVYQREQPLRWVAWLSRRAFRGLGWFNRFRIEVGIDLRGAPPIPRRTPASLGWMAAGCVLAALLGLGLWLAFPQGWRGPFVAASYVAYLAAVTALWGTLFLCFVGCIYVPIMLWSHLAPQSFYRSDSPRKSKVRSLLIVLAYVTLMGVGYAAAPMAVIVGMCLLSLALLQLLRLRRPRPEVAMIWRPAGSHRVFSVPSFRLAIHFLSLANLFAVALIMLACGGQVLGSDDGEKEMTMTVILGGLFAWTLPGMTAALGLGVTLLWLRNPARPAPPRAHLAGFFRPQDRRKLLELFRARGWQVQLDPAIPAPTDVQLNLVEPERSQAQEFKPTWPLKLSMEDLAEGSVFARIERRDELQKRHLFYRGLKVLFRSVRGREFTQGAGFWMAPHLWFQPSMTRDDEGEEREGGGLMQAIGPPYREVFDRAVRNYLFRVFRAVEVDIVFVEDGIRARSLKRVFRRLFEFFDKSRGGKRIEEVHFQGLPKVRVMLHDLQLDLPFESSRYPEPKYDVIGRARVLHLFKDRGDQEDLLDVPGDMNWSPAPMSRD